MKCYLQWASAVSYKKYDQHKFSYPSFPFVQWDSVTSNSHITCDPIKEFTIRRATPTGPPRSVLHCHGARSGCSCHGDGKGLSVHWWHCYHGNPHLSSGASRAGGVCSAPWTAHDGSCIPEQKLSHADCDRRDFHRPSPGRRQEADHTR